MLTPAVPAPQRRASDAARRASWRTGCLVAALISAGVVLHLQGLTWGFILDDNLHQYILRGLAPGDGGPLRDLYDFSPHVHFANAADEWRFQLWWADPAFKVRFFRPVTSLSLRLDHRLYHDWAPGYHLTSIALFAVFLALVYRLYQRLDLPPRAAVWALAAVAVNQAHTLPVEWIANRNTLLASLFTVATLLGVLGYQRTRRPTAAAFAAVCFLLACGSKESGVVALPLTVLVLLLGDPDGGGVRRAAFARLVRNPLVWLFVALAGAWIVFYVASGYGVRSDLYPAPWTDASAYLRRQVMLVPAALGALFFCVPLDLIAARPQSEVWIVGVVLVAMAVAARVFLRVVGRHRLAVLGLGWIVVCLLVEAGSEVSDRLLMNASIGAGLLVGLFFDAVGAQRAARATGDRRSLTLAAVLFGANLVAAVPVSLFRGHVFATTAAHDQRMLLDAEIDRSAPPPREVFLLNAPSALLLLTECGPTWSMRYDDRGTSFYPLQAGRRGLVWTRTGERAMTLTARGAPFVDQRLERLFRYRHPPHAGDTFRTPAFRATALAVEGSGIRTVLFEFDKPLEDPSYFFLRYQDDCLRRTVPPALGKTLELAEVPPPNAFVP